RLCRVEHLCQRRFILNKMFQDIEGAYDIKFAFEKNVACIHLIQLHLWQTCCGKDESIRENIAANQAHSWKVFANSSKHVTGSAANFQEAFGRRKILPKRPLNEGVPRAKPEMTWFNRS